MRKIKILQFPIANSKGGITQYILQNWKFIDKAKFEFDFATMSKSLDFENELKKTGSKIYYISCYAEDNKEKFVREFTEILSNGNYDIVHLHTKQSKSFLVERIAKEAGIKKVIIHAHSTGIETLDEKKRQEELQLHQYTLEKLTEDVATDYWACSQKAADFIFGNKISKAKIREMHNAIDLLRYTYNPNVRERYRKELDIKSDEYIIGNVGRFVYSKNQEFLLEVLASIYKKSKLKCKLLLVGSGEREEEYKKIAYKFGILQDVIFTGFRTDIPELLQAMDIFCLPSRFEGMPISIVEAQASGLLCLVSDVVTEESKVTENVYFCRLKIDEWIRAILQMIEKIPDREKRSAIMNQDFDIKIQIRNIEDAYARGIL